MSVFGPHHGEQPSSGLVLARAVVRFVEVAIGLVIRPLAFPVLMAIVGAVVAIVAVRQSTDPDLLALLGVANPRLPWLAFAVGGGIAACTALVLRIAYDFA